MATADPGGSLPVFLTSLLAFALAFGVESAEQVFHWLDYIARFDGARPLGAALFCCSAFTYCD